MRAGEIRTVSVQPWVSLVGWGPSLAIRFGRGTVEVGSIKLSPQGMLSVTAAGVAHRH